MRKTVSLFHRIERALETIALGETPLETIHSAAHFLSASFSDDLGLLGGRIYAQEDGEYELVRTFGQVTKAPIGFRVERSYPPMGQLLDLGSLVMRRDDHSLDQRLEDSLGTQEVFAAIAVSQGQYVLSFDVNAAVEANEELLSTLNIVRLAINQKLREEQVMAIIEDARRIQASILPIQLPSPGDFRISGRSLPAEIVGGDFYDVISFDDDTFFDVVIADATGHGLPAALQVRDVYTGLRMGLSREFKIERTLERLNRIIHRSRLATKFVSLIVAEINLAGTVSYCNAGHPAGLLMRASGELQTLSTGGVLLGPVASARYDLGTASMAPGDLLVLYTDGLTEAHDPASGEEYGQKRLIERIRSHRFDPPGAIIDAVFDQVAEFEGHGPPEDDKTMIVVQRQRADHPEEQTA